MKKYIYLAGGLGNNLFQVCYGFYLEQKGYEVVYKSFLLEKNIFTKLLKWSIHQNQLLESILKDKEVDSTIRFIDLLYLTKTLLVKKIRKDNLFTVPTDYSKKRYYGYYAKGEHLNKEVFKKLRNQIIKNNEINIKTKDSNVCTIHLRRGDFSSNYALSLDYYISALKQIDCIDEYILVTDNRGVYDEVKLTLQCNIRLSDATNMKEDFFEMFNSKNIIMSNSTFCYWATVLGDAEKIVHPDRISTDISWFFELGKRSNMILSTFESEKIK